jgi:uncharacterized membrane protein
VVNKGLSKKDKSPPKPATEKQIAQEIVKEIKKDPEYIKKAISIFDVEKGMAKYQTEGEVIYREDVPEEKYIKHPKKK